MFADFIIQPGHVRQGRLNPLDDCLPIFLPRFAHAVADVNGASNQVKGGIRTNMELCLVEAIGNHLIAVFAHAVHHFLTAVNDIEHKQRLHLAELRNLLHNRMIIAVGNVLGKLVPDKENTALGEPIAFNHIGNPRLEGIKVVD